MNPQSRILIVDNSRVVRAGLAKHLQGRFTVREEDNGESAWQTLVLDSSIVAVISGVQMQKLDGYGLLERLRENRLCRLKNMPFFLIVSDAAGEKGKERAKQLGVSDFLTKLMKKAEILERLSRVIDRNPCAEESAGDFSESDIGDGAILRRVARLTEIQDAADPDLSKDLVPAIEIQEQLLSVAEIEARIASAVAGAGSCHSPVSVLVLGIDNFQSLVSQFGENMAKRIGTRFARLLLGKLGPRDSIGHLRPDCCVIVSRGANLARCYAFAGRVCRSMSTAQIAVCGQPVRLAICAGAASVPDDGALAGNDLLNLAVSRMEGTRCSCARKQAVRQDETGIQALANLAALVAERPETLEPRLGAVGLQVLPLLKMLEREFGFGLPLPEIENRLTARARLEEIAE